LNIAIKIKNKMATKHELIENYIFPAVSERLEKLGYTIGNHFFVSDISIKESSIYKNEKIRKVNIKLNYSFLPVMYNSDNEELQILNKPERKRKVMLSGYIAHFKKDYMFYTSKSKLKKELKSLENEIEK
jgi:hypothetical protein